MDYETLYFESVKKLTNRIEELEKENFDSWLASDTLGCQLDEEAETVNLWLKFFIGFLIEKDIHGTDLVKYIRAEIDPDQGDWMIDDLIVFSLTLSNDYHKGLLSGRD